MPPIVVENPQELKKFVGREIGVTDWMTVEQQRIDRFAEATEDRQWIHIDPERAQRDSPYRTTIAHGFLTLSLLSHFLKQAIDVRGVRMAINYGLNRVRFPSAAKSGARIRARVALQSVEEVEKCLQATFAMTIESEGSAKPCCVAEWIIRFYV
jgi:acyl dehydratase